MLDHVIVRPGELALKGKNRGYFERLLHENLRHALAAVGAPKVERRHGRFYVGPIADAARAAKRAARVFGVVSTSPAVRCAADADVWAELGAELVGDALRRIPGDSPIKFKVDVKRADKSFPHNSMEVARALGGRILSAHPRLTVDLSSPDLTLGVEIRPEGSFLYLDKLRASGGLPVGCEGRVLALLSGGIDSPVACWLMMKRGCRVDLVHFDSRPFTGPGSLEKVRQLATILDDWQGGTRLLVVPFANIQLATRDLPNPGYRTVLYRRFMVRIAERLALARKAQALVTGDSLGQVASQTLGNLRVVEAARTTDLPLLRPLLGHDKEETIEIARRIGTFETSIQPFEDCCTLFQPDHPVTSGKPEKAAEIEALVDVTALVTEAVEKTERQELHPETAAR